MITETSMPMISKSMLHGGGDDFMLAYTDNCCVHGSRLCGTKFNWNFNLNSTEAIESESWKWLSFNHHHGFFSTDLGFHPDRRQAFLAVWVKTNHRIVARECNLKYGFGNFLHGNLMRRGRKTRISKQKLAGNLNLQSIARHILEPASPVCLVTACRRLIQISCSVVWPVEQLWLSSAAGNVAATHSCDVTDEQD